MHRLCVIASRFARPVDQLRQDRHVQDRCATCTECDGDFDLPLCLDACPSGCIQHRSPLRAREACWRSRFSAKPRCALPSPPATWAASPVRALVSALIESLGSPLTETKLGH
jgi:hypothetical protein